MVELIIVVVVVTAIVAGTGAVFVVGRRGRRRGPELEPPARPARGSRPARDSADIDIDIATDVDQVRATEPSRPTRPTRSKARRGSAPGRARSRRAPQASPPPALRPKAAGPPPTTRPADPAQTGIGGADAAVVDPADLFPADPGAPDVAPADRVSGDLTAQQRADIEAALAGIDEVAEQVEQLQADVETVLEGEPGIEEPEPEFDRPRFRDRLTKARSLFAGYLGGIRGRGKIDDETWEDLEEALIRADVGVATTNNLLDELQERVESERITLPEDLLDALKTDLKKTLAAGERDLRFEPGPPNVWLFVGVNGVGKTTTIGKVGKSQAALGRKVMMAAGDTFRAAAADQLQLWSERVGADIVRGADGADPASIVFDAIQAAGARGQDLVLADTAGRLHTKVNLMEELKKVRRVAEKADGQITEVFLVLDATTGQNGLTQAKQFTDAVELTGVVLTKLDGTAKGGIAIAIEKDLGIPIKLVGLGESADDLIAFDPDEFIEALFAE